MLIDVRKFVPRHALMKNPEVRVMLNGVREGSDTTTITLSLTISGPSRWATIVRFRFRTLESDHENPIRISDGPLLVMLTPFSAR